MGKMENGGVESVIMNYYRHIDRSKIQFDFFVDRDSSIPQKNEIESLGGKIYLVPPYQKVNAYITELIRLLKDNKYKIVHSNLNTLSVFPLYAAKKVGVPIRIAHNHSTAGKGETKKNIMKYMLRSLAKVNATHYAACSKYAGEWLFGKKSMEKGEVTVFNNAIDLDKFKYDEAVRHEVRKELGIDDKFVIGHVGRFCYQKNHEFLIKIFDKIHERDKGAVLMLIGTGNLVADVKKQVEDLGLTDCVIFLGNRFDCDRLYKAMDVFVLPSRYEGLPVVGVEAQASGVPCILSTAMTKETKMLDNTMMLGLDKSAEIWADKALTYKTYPKRDISDEIKNKGYDIITESVKMEKYYEDVFML